MENYWIFYALWGLTLMWLWDFIKKIVIKWWWDKDLFLFVCFFLYVIFTGVNFLFIWTDTFTDIEIKWALSIGLFDIVTPIWVMAAFKYLEISFALILIRIISSVWLLFIWMKFMWDDLSMANLIGFFMWIIAIFLLSGFKLWWKSEISKKWIIAAVWSSITIIFSHSYFKSIVADINIDNFMFLKFSISFVLLVLYMFFRKKFHNISKEKLIKVTPLALLTVSMFMFMFLYLLPNMYLTWPLSLSYKILSYSLIVPIILSIIFYKDEITKRKIIAFILTLVSLGLFII
jgi:hypothetical protein